MSRKHTKTYTYKREDSGDIERKKGVASTLSLRLHLANYVLPRKPEQISFLNMQFSIFRLTYFSF